MKYIFAFLAAIFSLEVIYLAIDDAFRFPH